MWHGVRIQMPHVACLSAQQVEFTQNYHLQEVDCEGKTLRACAQQLAQEVLLLSFHDGRRVEYYGTPVVLGCMRVVEPPDGANRHAIILFEASRRFQGAGAPQQPSTMLCQQIVWLEGTPFACFPPDADGAVEQTAEHLSEVLRLARALGEQQENASKDRLLRWLINS